MIEIKNLFVERKNKVVLNDVDLQVDSSEIIGLVGPNGSGKSTLIKTCAGVIRKKTGEIICDGMDIDLQKEKYMDRFQFCFDKAPFYPHLSGIENLMQNLCIYNVTRKDIIDALEFVGLEKRYNEKVSRYSFGMKQRLNIAQALVTKKPYIFMDEPFNGIDPDGIILFRKCFIEMKEKYKSSIVVSSHLLEELKNLCDRIVFIKNGCVVEEMNLKNNSENIYEIKTNMLEEAYSIISSLFPNCYLSDSKINVKISESEFNKCLKLLTDNDIVVYSIDKVNNIENVYYNKVGVK